MARKVSQDDGTSKVLDKEVEEVKEIITNIVTPQNRHNINIIQDHVTLLHGTKIKKQFSKKKLNEKSSKLTRKEYKRLGLYNIPSKSLKYDDVMPLYQLWQEYLKEHFYLNEDSVIPNVSDPKYDGFSKLLVKTDLHGAKIKVIKSRCPSYIGLSGIVILDTKNTFKVVGEDNKTRTIPKADCIFSIRYGNLEFIIFGKHITIRPAERSVKKVKNLIDLNL